MKMEWKAAWSDADNFSDWLCGVRDRNSRKNAKKMMVEGGEIGARLAKLSYPVLTIREGKKSDLITPDYRGVEVKFDIRSEETGNFYYEILSNGSKSRFVEDGNTFVIFFTPKHRGYLLNNVSLLESIEDSYGMGMDNLIHAVNSGDNPGQRNEFYIRLSRWGTAGILIPMRNLTARNYFLEEIVKPNNEFRW